MRDYLVIALSFAGLAVCEAAPAPFPKADSGAEVVLDAGTPDRVRLVLCYLRSDLFLTVTYQDAGFAKALPHRDDAARKQWLKAHLSVTAEGTLLRVRLRNAPGSFAALEAITAALTRVEKMDDAHREHRQLLRMLREAMSRREGCEDLEARRGMYAVEDEPLRVQTAPRKMRRGR